MPWTKDEKETVKVLTDRLEALKNQHEETKREHEGEIKVLKAEVAILKHFLFAIILAVIGAALVAAVGLKK